MAIKKTNEQNYINIANAIRTVNGSEETYTPGEMAQAILDLEVGGMVIESLTDSAITTMYPSNNASYSLKTIENNDYVGIGSIIANALSAGNNADIADVPWLKYTVEHLTYLFRPTLAGGNMFAGQITWVCSFPADIGPNAPIYNAYIYGRSGFAIVSADMMIEKITIGG